MKIGGNATVTARRENRLCGLGHDGQDLRPLASQQVDKAAQVIPGFRFRQYPAIWRGRQQGGKIIAQPTACERIHANKDRGPGRPLIETSRHRAAGFGLGGWGDSVFKIKDQGIGTRICRLGHQVRAVARHEEKGSEHQDRAIQKGEGSAVQVADSFGYRIVQYAFDAPFAAKAAILDAAKGHAIGGNPKMIDANHTTVQT